MQQLNFPEYPFRFKINENKRLIFDIIRKKFVMLTPEEWVRQHTVHYLIQEKGYPQSYISVEKTLLINGLKKRYDIIVHRPDGGFFLLVECKEPAVAINQAVFDQIARYNMVLKSDFLMVTNGINHYYCKIDSEKKRYLFLRDIPNQSEQ